MARPRFWRRLGAAALFAVLAFGAAHPSLASAQQRIGYVDPQRVVDATRLGRTAKADLARYVAERNRLARESAAQVTALRQAARAPGLSAAERARREDAYRRKSAEHERLVEENARDIRSEENRLLRYILRRASVVLQTIGREGGYALIITDPNVVGYVAKSGVDLTDRVAHDLDARSK